MTDTRCEDLIVMEIVGDLEIPCDFAGDPICANVAKWVLGKACPVCGISGARLSCEPCKDARMSSECGVVCQPGCEEVVAPARHMYIRVEAL